MWEITITCTGYKIKTGCKYCTFREVCKNPNRNKKDIDSMR